MLNNMDETVLNTGWEKENHRFPGPVASGGMFSLTAILLTYGGFLLPFKNDYLRSGLGELLFILFPVMVLLTVGRYNVKDTLKLNKVKPVNYVIIVFLMVFGMPVVGALNAIVIGIIRWVFGKNLAVPPIDVPDAPALLAAILVIGVSAAVCEEVLFRGVISKGYARYGVVAQMIFTSLLFGILHRDIQKLVSTTLLGALIGFIVYRTNSVYAGIAAHFTNNTVAVLITFSAQRTAQKLSESGMEFSQREIYELLDMPVASLIAVIIVYLFLFMGFVSAFTALFYAFCRSTGKRSLHLNEPGESIPPLNPGKKFALPAVLSALPGILLILLIFASQFLTLMDVSSGMLYDLLRVLKLR